MAAPAAVQRLVDEALPSSPGRFVREQEIGHGGMGTVEAARDLRLQRRVAMKLMRTEMQRDPQSVQMFLREGRITGQLDHPSTVPVHEMGLDDRGRLYFTMKLVEGTTLGQLIAARPHGPLEHGALLNLLDVVVKVCDALAFAHSRGILHCDVKPANVMVGDFGEVYLMDWGVARVRPDAGWMGRLGDRNGLAADHQTDDATKSSIVGTIEYMSPEQASGANELLSPRSDVFSVGAMIYELLAQRPPYRAGSYPATLLLAQDARHPSLESLLGAGTLPRELVRIVARAMAPDPEARYPSARELRSDLVRFMRGGGQFPQRRFAPGEVIVREGEVGDAAFIISSGTCQVHRLLDGKPVLLRTMFPGEVFGETAILSPGLRTASVVAVDDVTVHVVTKDVLESEVDSLKPWLGAFIRTLASRFRQREEERRDSLPPEPPFDPARAARLGAMVMAMWGERVAGDESRLWMPAARFVDELRKEITLSDAHVDATLARLGFERNDDGETAIVTTTKARLAELKR